MDSEDREIIKVIIVNDDGTETEVDPKTLNCIKLEISNSDQEFQVEEEDEIFSEEPTEDVSALLENIKVELIEDPEEEFGEYLLSENFDEESETEDLDEDEDYETDKPRKRKRIEHIESTRRRHTCHICGYTSHQKSHYRRHLAIHYKPDGIFCSICRQEMSDKTELSDHMEEHKCSYDQNKFQCHVCEYTSKKLTNVSQHTEIHYKPEKDKLKCDKCDYSTTSQSIFKKHRKIHIKPNMRCPVCLVSFKDMTARRKHLQRYKNGPEENKYQCPECSYRTIKFNNFKQHMVVHRNEYEIEMFQCSHCPFKSKRKTDLRQHEIVKHKTDEECVLFKCDFCTYKTRRGNHLTSHMRNRHSREVIMKKCGLCSYKTASQMLIDKHCSIHSKVPDCFFLCSTCGDGFLSVKQLNAHFEKTHSNNEESVDDHMSDNDSNVTDKREIDDEGYSVELRKVEAEDDGESEMETLYSCQFSLCNFKSKFERDAKIHKTICHNKRGDDNRCPECTFHTTSRYLYLDHLKVHEIDIEHLKPHLCDICGTRWIRQGDLTRHMSVHWGGEAERRRKVKSENSDKKPLQCTICSYSTLLRLCLYKHMLKHGKEHQKDFNMIVASEDCEYETDEAFVDGTEYDQIV